MNRFKSSSFNPVFLFCGLIVAFLLLIFIVIGIFQARQKNFEILAWFAMIILSIAIFYLLINLIKSINVKKIAKSIICGVLIIAFAIGIWEIYAQLKKQYLNFYTNIQDCFTGALSAQYLGDDIIAGKSNANFADVGTQTNNAVDCIGTIKPDSSMQTYYNDIYGWSQVLNIAAASKEAWKSRPDAPVGSSSPTSRGEYGFPHLP